MAVFDHADFDDHESLHFFRDAPSGLRAIIAVHSTALGPGAGGCRRWTYASDADALTDALRLSRGMTYKNAVAELPFGGAKAVILASDAAPKSDALFAALGSAVDSLAGRYITAEDVGASVNDMRHVQSRTRFVSGLPQSGNDAGGDPSPWTAIGVFLGIKAAVESRLGRNSLDGVSVAVQGVGHVGAHLCKLLDEAGAKLVIADVNNDHLTAVRDTIEVEVVPPGDILFTDVDVLAPCALGNIFTSATIPKLSATVIAGAANNQLSTQADGARLAERGILYAPDYVINAGGIISVSHEYHGQSSATEVQRDVEKIPDRLRALFADARESERPTNELADELARALIAASSGP